VGTALIHVVGKDLLIQVYDDLGKNVYVKSGRLDLSFSEVGEVRITPYVFKNGVMVVVSKFKDMKVREVEEVEEIPSAEGREIEE